MLWEVSEYVMKAITLNTPTYVRSKEQFVDALVISDMRIRIKQTRPKNIKWMTRYAMLLELEAYIRAGRKQQESQRDFRTTTTGKTSDTPRFTQIDLTTL